MDYTYKLPAGNRLRIQLISLLRANEESRLSDMLVSCKLSMEDVGLAFYAGVQGNTWDKHAIDVTLFVPDKDIVQMRPCTETLKHWINKLLPQDSGLVLRKIIIKPASSEPEQDDI